MKNKSTMLALTFLALLGSTMLLSACHTTAGLGEDISRTGSSIERSADQHSP